MKCKMKKIFIRFGSVLDTIIEIINIESDSVFAMFLISINGFVAWSSRLTIYFPIDAPKSYSGVLVLDIVDIARLQYKVVQKYR